MIGTQEVVFGDEMLNELVSPVGSRTKVSAEHGFHAFEAPVQLPIFKLMKNLDHRAKLDGNAILKSKDPLSPLTPEMIADEKTLHLSGTRNCQLVKFALPSKQQKRHLFFVNAHLHSLIEDDYVRLTQAEMTAFWLDQLVDYSNDLVIWVGDFNAKPDSETYKFILR